MELYEVVADACRAVDPDHLFLGSRFRDLDSEWLRAGMDHVDVVTLNCYRPRIPEKFGEWAAELGAPIMIGEFTFSALDVGLPAPGHQRVPDQPARGDAYRVYLEHVAVQPWCVGAHFYQLYDESALGRFDGQNCNLGFFDVCHRPYDPLVAASRESHERLYDLATGEVDPIGDEPAYRTER